MKHDVQEEPETQSKIQPVRFRKPKSKKRKFLDERQLFLITKAISDPNRYEMLKLLANYDGTEMPCMALRGFSTLTAATISHHMRELEIAGLIENVRAGKCVKYHFKRDVLETYISQLKVDLMLS
jgi:ArsR family transcriptional regulator, arsenate/arsenite/antimonite-responsive transcriptional repressor